MSTPCDLIGVDRACSNVLHVKHRQSPLDTGGALFVFSSRERELTKKNEMAGSFICLYNASCLQTRPPKNLKKKIGLVYIVVQRLALFLLGGGEPH